MLIEVLIEVRSEVLVGVLVEVLGGVLREGGVVGIYRFSDCFGVGGAFVVAYRGADRGADRGAGRGARCRLRY